MRLANNLKTFLDNCHVIRDYLNERCLHAMSRFQRCDSYEDSYTSNLMLVCLRLCLLD
jgi:hypothetical protein